eukprot:8114420-Pyramimonas_sp.AAC.1
MASAGSVERAHRLRSTQTESTEHEDTSRPQTPSPPTACTLSLWLHSTIGSSRGPGPRTAH